MNNLEKLLILVAILSVAFFLLKKDESTTIHMIDLELGLDADIKLFCSEELAKREMDLLFLCYQALSPRTVDGYYNCVNESFKECRVEINKKDNSK